MASPDPVAEGLTRKQRRDAARAHRKALETAQASSTLRRRRLAQLAIVVSIVAAGFIAAIISTNGAGETAPGSPAAKNTERAVNATVGGISQKGNALGFTRTPSFRLGRTGKTMRAFAYTSLTDPTSFNEAIEQLISG